MLKKMFTFFLIGTLAVMLTTLPGCQADGCGCPPLWTPFQDNCYRYFSVKNITWLGAEMHCSSFSVPCTGVDAPLSLGHLTSIHSKEEMDFLAVTYEDLRSKVITSFTRVWIGLHDKSTEGSWKWSDGSSVDYEKWESGQPNSYQGDQDCAEFHSSNEYTWNDLACDTDNDSDFTVTGYICKLPQW
ncbi:echinoidin-like [Lytechinus variegatus]|uniref:echinoidin-like n=1 Tax=Lytechinus variegatus TaxID=7654 RepID=UPI001BB2357E|nr:echinoidin-like [Lytechinus variegatus]